MKLSFVIELLLIFLLIAFAASRVIDTRDAKGLKSQQKQDNAPNRYCSCSTDSCDCCREFSLPVIPIKGPGCASLQYLKGDNMALTMKFGDRVLATHTISGKRPKPVCMRLPGGFSRFCGRVYGISREPDAFHACLGLEIRAFDDLEAALRVSCFRFSPEGLRLEPAKPVPADDDDDEDEDDYGFGDDDDDDEEEEESEEEEDEEEEEEGTLGGAAEDEEDDDEIAAGVGDDNEISADYAGFSILGDLLGLDDDSVEVPVKKKPNRKTASTPAPVPVVTPTQTPHKVIVQVHHIHNAAGTEAVAGAPAPSVVTNNKVMDKVEVNKVQDQTAAPPATPTKAPAKPPQKAPTKAPTRAPTRAPPKVPTRSPTKAPAKPVTKPPPKSTTTQAVTEQPSSVTVMTFSPITSSDFSVNVVQDGQALQGVDDVRTPDAVTEQENVIEITTMSEGEEGMMSDDADKVAGDPTAAPDEAPAAVAEEANDEEKTEVEPQKDEDKEESEVAIGVVKEEEVTAADDKNVATTEMSPAPQGTSPAVLAPEASVAAPSPSATVEKDDDDAEADDVVEEVEDAVATVLGAGVDEEDEGDDDEEEDDEEEEEEEEEDKEEEEKEEEDSEEETEKPQEEEDDEEYEDDDEEEEEEEEGEKEEDPVASTSENPTTTGAEKRWRRRKNRLDHIFWQ